MYFLPSIKDTELITKWLWRCFVFKWVVTTHLNTKHFHNHFVLNSVSFIDGKKYNADRNSYAEFRRLNDLICMEHGKSVLKEQKTKSGINYLNSMI